MADGGARHLNQSQQQPDQQPEQPGGRGGTRTVHVPVQVHSHTVVGLFPGVCDVSVWSFCVFSVLLGFPSMCVSANGYLSLSLCGSVMNWRLVHCVTLPSPCDSWRRIQKTPVTLRTVIESQWTDDFPL